MVTCGRAAGARAECEGRSAAPLRLRGSAHRDAVPSLRSAILRPCAQDAARRRAARLRRRPELLLRELAHASGSARAARLHPRRTDGTCGRRLVRGAALDSRQCAEKLRRADARAVTHAGGGNALPRLERNRRDERDRHRAGRICDRPRPHLSHGSFHGRLRHVVARPEARRSMGGDRADVGRAAERGLPSRAAYARAGPHLDRRPRESRVGGGE